MSTSVIEVRIWGARVGAVAVDSRLGAYVFEYDPTWIRKKIELSPLIDAHRAAERSFCIS